MADIKFVRLKFTDADALRAACDDYFAYVDSLPSKTVMVGKSVVERRVPYTPAGLARRLGITTQTLGKYLRGEVAFPDTMKQKTQNEILTVLTDARMKIEDDISTKALMNELDNAVSRQVLGVLGYGKCIDDAGEEANNTFRVVIEGASKSDIASWSK